MAPDDDDNRDDIEDIKLSSTPRYDMNTEQRLALVIERQNNLMRRVGSLEKRQGEISSLLNKVTGALALIAGASVVIGWLLSVSGQVFSWFK